MEIPVRFDAKSIEDHTRRRLESVDVRGAIEDSGRPAVTFIEGPPTLNGSPHAGHLRGRVIKDLWYRYTTLTGKEVAFQGGWDTQGLPVELQAEKELGVTGGKNEIAESVGIERLVSACKGIVEKYNRHWERVDRLMGMSMDHTKSYWTYKDEYIEREWQVLKKAREAGILDDDYTVIGYCPGCQTSLSHAEVNQGYDMVQDPSLYYKVRMLDEDMYLVVWTTMPFTLVTDAMVGLHPDEDYAVVRVDDQRWVVGVKRLEQFMEEAGISGYVVERTIKGSWFDGKRYVHPLLDRIPGLAGLAEGGNYHMAVAEQFVDAAAGSGLVHLAPANGEDDIAIAKRRGIGVFCPIDEQVRFTEPAGEYKGMFVRDADSRIVEDLREAGALVKIGRIRHKYPLCWRSKHQIVWLARRGWFYKLDRLGGRTLEAARSVRYFFEAPKNRFLGIVGESHPWCISRERYWGCPMPVWDCRDCHAKTWCYSRDEIIRNARDLPDGPGFELHRPWVDRISVRCCRCGGYDTVREQYVLDTWHNSGAAPFASQTDEAYSDNIPAPFFTEGIDQTRGWAYTLLVENVIISGSPAPPYRAFLFQGHVLDEKGGKMSKSLGNVLDAEDLLRQHPADMVRLYFMWKASPVETLNFSTQEMSSRPYQILSTLYNLHVYYLQNGEYDGYRRERDVAWANGRGLLEPPDLWLLAKMQRTIRLVTEKIDACRFHEAARAIDDFLINSLSQSYVQTVRSELWEDDDSRRDRRHAIYAVISESLRCLDIMIHPFCPFTSEYLYGAAFGGRESVLLEEWPRPDDSLEDAAIEDAFDSMRTILSVAAAARAKAKLKRRWPLERAQVVVPEGKKDGAERLRPSLQQQMNVEVLEDIKEGREESGLAQILEMKRLGMPIRPVIELDRKRLGPRIKGSMAGLLRAFSEADPWEIVGAAGSGRCAFDVDGKSIELDRDDFVFSYEPEEGYQAASRDGYAVFVSTVHNQTTTARWHLRDVARRLQNLRKERGYNPTQILDAASILGLDRTARMLVESGEYDLASLVRVRRISFVEKEGESYKEEDIDGQKIRIAIIQDEPGGAQGTDRDGTGDAPTQKCDIAGSPHPCPEHDGPNPPAGTN